MFPNTKQYLNHEKYGGEPTIARIRSQKGFQNSIEKVSCLCGCPRLDISHLDSLFIKEQ